MLLFNALHNLDQSVADLDMIDESEKTQLLVEWNDTARNYPRNRCVTHYLEDQVNINPHKIAVRYHVKVSLMRN